MASLPIAWIEARTYCHATEDEGRVAQALAFALPEGDESREILEGHFGNALVRLTRRVKDRKAVRPAWERWASSDLGRAISDDVEARVDDEGVLHFRLDKQAAYQGRLALAGDSDALDVRLKLLAYPAKPERARQVARSILPEAR